MSRPCLFWMATWAISSTMSGKSPVDRASRSVPTRGSPAWSEQPVSTNRRLTRVRRMKAEYHEPLAQHRLQRLLPHGLRHVVVHPGFEHLLLLALQSVRGHGHDRSPRSFAFDL